MPKPFLRDTSKMEQNQFALGLKKQESKRQKKERLRRFRERTKHSSFTLQKSSMWRILPNHVCEGFEFWIDVIPGDFFWNKCKHVKSEMDRIQNETAELIPFSITHIEFQDTYKEKAKKVLGLLYSNQTLRWRLKRFFTLLRIQRFRKLNEKDPITMDAVKQPILLYSFPQRLCYTFEAESFARHIHKQLLTNDGQIPTPIQPRNPYTNSEFTLAQLISIYKQSTQYGHTSWALEAFRMCRFNLQTFSILHSKPLRLNAFRSTMAKPQEYDAIDTLYDFIKSQHEEHGFTFYPSLYKWALHTSPSEKRIQDWRKYCIQWYETEILTDDPYVKALTFSKLSQKTILLCDSPTDLKQAKSLKSSITTDGSCSV